MRGKGLTWLGWLAAGSLAVGGAAALARDGAPDAETRAWWALTEELSSDAMEGRDTGSPGFDRAAAVVAARPG